MITKLKKFLPTEGGVTVTLKFSEADMPQIMRLYGQDVTVIPAQEALPEEPVTMETLDDLADGIANLAKKFKEQYKKSYGELPPEESTEKEEM